jgi:hypothetical protein
MKVCTRPNVKGIVSWYENVRVVSSSFTFLNAELIAKRLMKCTYLKRQSSISKNCRYCVILQVDISILEEHAASSFIVNPEDGGNILSETLVSTYKITQCHSPEDHYLNSLLWKTENLHEL